MISLEKHGREVDQRTKEEWVRAASVSTSRDNCLVVEWAEKRRESLCDTHRGQMRLNGQTANAGSGIVCFNSKRPKT